MWKPAICKNSCWSAHLENLFFSVHVFWLRTTCVLVFFRDVARIFQRGRGGGVTLCKSEGARQIVMSFTPPVVGCLLKKGLQKGGRVTSTPGPPCLCLCNCSVLATAFGKTLYFPDILIDNARDVTTIKRLYTRHGPYPRIQQKWSACYFLG